jgi:organic radical activating enzyme
VTTTLTLPELIEWRRIPGRTALLYLTDRCPVGCTHCSVDATGSSPRVDDHVGLDHLVRELVANPDLRSVGISGGEPFVERRALTASVGTITDAGKLVVPYTSGAWSRTPPRWIHRILERSAAVVLSTDTFHDAGVTQRQVRVAAEAIVAAGARLIVQVVDVGESVQRAVDLVVDCFGDASSDVADVHVVPLIGVGRGTDLLTVQRRYTVDQLPPCRAAASPVIAYDGRVTPCCNEALINGEGPVALRPRVTDPTELAAVVRAVTNGPLISMMRTAGPAAVASLPGFDDLATRSHRSLCDFCWQAHERRATLADEEERVLRAAALIAR